jgi:hypothetical protein
MAEFHFLKYMDEPNDEDDHTKSIQNFEGEVQCRAEQCRAVQSSAEQSNAEQCEAVQ